jgi:lysozyme family protein
LSGEYIQGATALAKLNELYMEIAVDTGSDMIFTLEEFCGHGYRRDNMNSPCYIPDAEQYFDISCIHPTPAGHHRIAEMFELLVDE